MDPNEFSSSPSKLDRRVRKAVAGCGCAFVLLFVLMIVQSFVHVFISARTAARESRRFQAMERLRKGLVRYANAHGGVLPHDRWSDAIRPYEATLEADLSLGAKGDGTSFALMPRALGRRLSDFGANDILLVQYRTWERNAIALDPSRVSLRSGVDDATVSGAGHTSRRPLAEVEAQIRNVN